MNTKKMPEAGNQKYKVNGQVLNSIAEPIMGQEILAVDVDLRGAAVYKTVSTVGELVANKGFRLLGKEKTNSGGIYEIKFTGESFHVNKIGLADVLVCAIDGDAITARSSLAKAKDFTKNVLQNWNIKLPDASKRGIGEFARLFHAVEPVVKDSGLQLAELSASTDQMTFLATETSQDPGHTALLVQAFKLKSDYPSQRLSTELFYALGRQEISLTWVALAQINATGLTAAIEQSIADNIIAPDNENAILAFVNNVVNIAAEYASTAPETSTFFTTIGYAVADTNLQKAFAQAYLQFQGQPQDFWNSLAQTAGFTPAIIGALQLTNQLSILTGQNTSLMKELQVTRNITDPSDLLSLTDSDWNTLVAASGVPDSTPGATTAEKVANYVTSMQTLLIATYPTQKIALMVPTSLSITDANIQNGVSGFLATAQPLGFDFGLSRISDFAGTAEQVVPPKYHDDVVNQLELIQRIYQVSPNPEVMSALLSNGYTSAHHIASMSQSTFLSQESADLGGSEMASTVYNLARHQVMRAQHTLLRMRDVSDNATPAKVISSDQQSAINNYLKTFNT